MDRKEFLKKVGLTLGAVVIAPIAVVKIFSESEKIFGTPGVHINNWEPIAGSDKGLISNLFALGDNKSIKYIGPPNKIVHVQELHNFIHSIESDEVKVFEKTKNYIKLDGCHITEHTAQHISGGSILQNRNDTDEIWTSGPIRLGNFI